MEQPYYITGENAGEGGTPPFCAEVKKQKVKIKKNIFQVIFNKLIFMVVVAALIIGGVYYCYTQNLLPEFAQNQVEEFDKTLQNVINLKTEMKNI